MVDPYSIVWEDGRVKTTVEIADGLLAEVKIAAARRAVAVRELIEEGLRLVLERERRPGQVFRLQDGSFFGEGGMRREFSWPELCDLIYEDRGGINAPRPPDDHAAPDDRG